jgi:TolB-like protein/Tfp pilus assembly protein PilF
VSESSARFVKELRRRRVFRTAGLYVVGAWLVLQAATMLFPGWGVPGEAIRFLFWAILLGLPVALVFGWIFEITPDGIQRTRPVDSPEELAATLPLGRRDYLILAAFLIVIGLIVVDATGRVMRTAPVVGDDPHPRPAEVVENSLAVLPFTNLSADPGHEPFADGISEEILNRLSAFNELKVIARTSSFLFKDSGYDVRRICDLLGVEYLLQGSVRRDNGHLRISAALVDRSGFQLWHATLDRELGGIFALQDEIAEAVATSILPQIAPPPAAMRLPDLEAYEQYLLGRDLLAARTPGWHARSQQHFSRAIELDPEFAEAYAERAIVLTFQSGLSEIDGGTLDRAQHDIDTALSLKPNLARAHAAQVMVHWEREPAESKAREQMLLHILALDPNMVDALNWLAMSYTQQGRRNESEAVLRRAARIDPLAPAVNFNLALAESARGDSAQAEERLLRLLEIPEPSDLAFVGLLRLYQRNGRLVDALQTSKRQILHRAKGDTGLEPGVFLELPWNYVMLGMWEQAEYWQAWSERRWPDIYFVRLFRMRVARHAGLIESGQYAAEFRAALAETGTEIDRLPLFFGLVYGEAQALSGEYDGAIETLEPLAGPGRTLPPGISGDIHPRQALAWAWLQTGEPERAVALLEPVDGFLTQRLAAGEFVSDSNWLASFALNTVVLGDESRAIELLERAVDAGWRDYYLMIHDPRWDALREHPQVVDLLARVKAEIERQRAELEAIEAEEDFAARLDAALAANEARAAAR